MVSHEQAKAGAGTMALAASVWIRMGSAELANAVASIVSMDERAIVYIVALEAIHHRVDHGWVECKHVEKCAEAMSIAWTETVERKNLDV